MPADSDKEFIRYCTAPMQEAQKENWAIYRLRGMCFNFLHGVASPNLINLLEKARDEAILEIKDRQQIRNPFRKVKPMKVDWVAELEKQEQREARRKEKQNDNQPSDIRTKP